LQSIQTKKIPVAISGCARRSEVSIGDVCFLLIGSLSMAGFDPANANGIAWTYIFAKDIRSLSVDLNSVPKKARAEGICAIKKRVWPRRHRNGAS
jgi:hypothetical protein